MTQGNDYANAGRDFLTQAFDELSQGKLTQASEKGWGAAAQMVKAVSAVRGWEHNGHAPLFQAVRRVVAETGDSRISELFHIANSLHVNFYENWLPEELVQSGLNNVRELVEKLEQLSQ
jgi:hypothetical protein